jgi:predicted dinucleotide-binding enzyme
MNANKIGVLGSGVVAQTLAAGFLKYGYEVMVGTREPAKLAEWKAKSAPGAKLGSFADTAKFGEIVVLAVKGTVAETLVKSLAAPLAGKVVLDAVNPIKDEPPLTGGVLQFFTNFEKSLMEALQAAAPQAKFVKVFNSVGAGQMINPQYKEGRPTMFICGNDAEAKKSAGVILDKFGWEVEDMGPAAAARAIEPLCILWCIPGFSKNQWTHAFKMLKK